MRYSIDDNNALARLVRKLRIELGLTQQQLALQAGVSFSFINQIERGKDTVRLDAVNKVLKVFGHSMMPTRVYPRFATPLAKPSPIVRDEGKVTEEKEPSVSVSSQKNDWAFY